jgi:hypothetical protein
MFPVLQQNKKHHPTVIMKYLLFFTSTQEALDLMTDPAKAGETYAAWNSYKAALDAAGVVVTPGVRMAPPKSATTVRIRDGKRLVQDGPYAETKEMLAGMLTIDVPDLDAALEWAARSPAASYSSVEVRPLHAGS